MFDEISESCDFGIALLKLFFQLRELLTALVGHRTVVARAL